MPSLAQPSVLLMAIVALVVVGAFLVVEAIRTLWNKSPDIEHDSAVDKWLFSSDTRYFLGRYYAGGQLLAAGVFCFVAAFIIYVAK